MKYTTLLALAIGIFLVSCSQEAEQAKEEKTTITTITTQEEIKTTNNTLIMKPIYLTKAEFLKKVVNYEESPNEWKYLGDKPAIIDFYASWCGPCKMIAPILDELAAEYAGEIYIYKIDTEQEQELAAAFGIQSIPTLLLVPMNENPQVIRGALPKAQFKEAIDKTLLKK
ncbi:MAG: thioredoxin [Paludibacteraceae bacterium]|nr:thioredoxin [Paludibacteraceae bacterium]MBP6284612.1 thioredoxin [Paludibacteraceae bacterium]